MFFIAFLYNVRRRKPNTERKVLILRNVKKKFYTSLGILLAFVVWTVAVRFLDVQAIGPNGSRVGFATINGFLHEKIGVYMPLYVITDWLGLVPVAFMFGFAVLGLVQWIKRRRFLKVDGSILILGCFYILILLVYLFFETVIINYRPVWIDGYLEASYPSSTTLLVGCVMPTSILQLQDRIQNKKLKNSITCVMVLFIGFMVFGRLVSGVHWFTDIVGGALLSAGLVALYGAFCKLFDK